MIELLYQEVKSPENMGESSEVPYKPIIRGPQDPRVGESWISDGVEDSERRKLLKAGGAVLAVGVLGKILGLWDKLANVLAKPAQPNPHVSSVPRSDPIPSDTATAYKAESDAIRDAINKPVPSPTLSAPPADTPQSGK